VVPFPGIDLLALLIDGRRNDHLYDGNVVAGYGLRGQTTVRHLGDKYFERAIVDFGQWKISDVWVDPFFETALPQFQRCWCNWFALTTLDVVEPPFCMFAECDTLGLLHHFVEVLQGVRATLRDDFTGAAFSFRFGQMTRSGDRAYLGSHMLSGFQPCHIHPPTNDPPFTTCFDIAVLTSSAGHALSSPLHRCRENDINIAG